MPQVKVRVPGYYYPRSSPSVRLVWGHFTDNPGEAKTDACYGCRKDHRPHFLARNFHDSALELWGCEGCGDILIRVEREVEPC